MLELATFGDLIIPFLTALHTTVICGNPLHGVSSFLSLHLFRRYVLPSYMFFLLMLLDKHFFR